MASNTAPIKWAQRTDSLYITIALPDVKDETINLTDTELHFKGKSNDKDYEVSIKFLKAVDSKDSTYKVHPRNIQMNIMKAQKEGEEGEEEDEEFWPRLLEDKALEKNQVKIDWDRYVDEDEEDEAGGFDMAGVEGGSGMGGMPGMGGMGGGMPGMGGGMPGMPGMGGGMPGMPGMGGGMPGMGGGMPGMGGGMPGMGGGMPGMEGMDMEALMKQMGGMGGGAPMAEEDSDDEIDNLPDLEGVEAAKKSEPTEKA